MGPDPAGCPRRLPGRDSRSVGCPDPTTISPPAGPELPEPGRSVGGTEYPAAEVGTGPARTQDGRVGPSVGRTLPGMCIIYFYFWAKVVKTTGKSGKWYRQIISKSPIPVNVEHCAALLGSECARGPIGEVSGTAQ